MFSPRISSCSSSGTPAKLRRSPRATWKVESKVRVVGAPHHLVHTDQVAAAHAGTSSWEGGVHLATPVVGTFPVSWGKRGAKRQSTTPALR